MRAAPQPVDIIEAVIGPQVRGNPRALATSVAGALKSAGLLKPPQAPCAPASEEPPRPVGATRSIFTGGLR